jgi:N-acetyl-gamma-glutamylphosphate reductase
VLLHAALLPVNRGILTTAHILLREPMEQKEVETLYQKFYENEFFVRYQKPTLAAVGGRTSATWRGERGRTCRRGLGDRHLVKGASGQAIQNMNLMCGFAEDDGLRCAGMLPEVAAMQVRDIMTPNPVTVRVDSPVREAAGLLRKYHIGGSP